MWPVKPNAVPVEHSRVALQVKPDTPLTVAGTNGSVLAYTQVSAKSKADWTVYVGPEPIKKFLKIVKVENVSLALTGTTLTLTASNNTLDVACALNGYTLTPFTANELPVVGQIKAGLIPNVYAKVFFGPEYTVFTTDKKQLTVLGKGLPVALTVPTQYFKNFTNPTLYGAGTQWALQENDLCLYFTMSQLPEPINLGNLLTATPIATAKVDLSALSGLKGQDTIMLKVTPPDKVVLLGAGRETNMRFEAKGESAGTSTIKLPPLQMVFKGQSQIEIIEHNRVKVARITNGPLVTIVSGLIR